jgi:hypothetical protein
MEGEIQKLKAENERLKVENERLTAKLLLMEKSFADLFGKMKSDKQNAMAASPPNLSVMSSSGSSSLANFFKSPRVKSDGTKTLPYESKTVGRRKGAEIPAQRSASLMLPDLEEGRRRAKTMDGRDDFGGEKKVTSRGSASVISPRDLEVCVFSLFVSLFLKMKRLECFTKLGVLLCAIILTAVSLFLLPFHILFRTLSSLFC